jgi:hypothetical protein
MPGATPRTPAQFLYPATGLFQQSPQRLNESSRGALALGAAVVPRSSLCAAKSAAARHQGLKPPGYDLSVAAPRTATTPTVSRVTATYGDNPDGLTGDAARAKKSAGPPKKDAKGLSINNMVAYGLRGRIE